MKPFERITISSPEIMNYPASWRILKNLAKYQLLPPGFEDPEIVDATQVSNKLAFEAPRVAAPANNPVALGKRILHLTTQPGTFIKQCPGTTNMLCCQYHIVNMVSNCPFDCTYCYLQTYLNQPMTTFYVNEDDIFAQVSKLCERPPVAQLRVGTGELSDSLALDPITGFSVRLADMMSKYENVRLELKTKSKNVEHLLELKKRDHVVVGWSMNPREIINAEEHGTARFEERLKAAALMASEGFGVAFHFDPMIYTDGWQEMYEAAATELLANVDHKQIRWVSIGGLRYQPQLKPIALKRRPETTLFMDETAPGTDGKVRYLRSQRTEMFQFLNRIIKERAPTVYTYLCMESMPVWEKALGRMPDRGF
ncbi:MAG: radical SAM protein [Deltaproteobacteria bacterium]|nr:radical SAM protein [Deltaproteobacteria bacterium]